MIGVRVSVLTIAGIVAFVACPVAADDREPVAHWKLAGDAKDSSANRLDATNRGAKFTAKGPDGKSPAALFDGIGNHLEVKSAPALRLGTGDFTVALWVHTPESLDDDLGDLVTMYDAKKRVGFNLSLRNNTGVTSSQANTRQLQFGIDAGSEPKWADEGRPGNATLAFALAVHDGNLYAGTASHAKDEVGRVYRHEGAGKWADCGAPDTCNAISALAVHHGKLYAASSKYRFAGSALPESENANRGGGVYRYEGEKRWTEVGRLPDTEAVGGLVVFKDRLYASSLYKPAGFFRYESDGKWTSLAVPDGKRVESLGVFNGHLWATSYDGGRVYRYDGKEWKDFGQLGDNTQTYSFAVHRGRLCVGTWPSGKVYRLNEDRWEDLGRLGAELEVMGMLVHNGQLYAGTLPLAEVHRYDGGQTWTKTGQLDKTPDVKYRRAWTMAQYKGKLFCSTLPSGRVHSLEAGPCVTHDRELAPGWRHVAAVKRGGLLQLYVDGKAVAESAKFDAAKFDLTTDATLLIGAGAGDHLNGALADVRLYRRALGAEEIAGLPVLARAAPDAPPAEAPEKVAFFESKVRPLLLAKCVECHGEKKAKGGLRLDSRAGWVKGGESGPAVVPGKPDESPLIKAVRYLDKDLQMPPKKALPTEDVKILEDWVRQGAVDPRNDVATTVPPGASEWDVTFQKRLDWWSLKPLRPVDAPKAFEGPWGRDPIDRFVKAGLDGAGLKPAARAEPEVLLRRLSFVLTGLPPTAALRDRFLTLLREDEAKAYEKLVDELLSSPHFGERFARHWMDVVRYTDTYGYEWDNPAKGSHEYRDYLIRAFNGDLPYDQFVREQLAGDLLPKPRVAAGVNESLIGPMFFNMGEHRHGSSLEFNGVHQEMINNKIDALSKTFLGLTVACARCHDHKLEAVSQRDYYALAAVLMTPRWTSRVIDAPGKNDAAIRQLKALRDDLRTETAAVWRRAVEKPDDWAASGWRKRVRPKDAKAPALEEIDYPLVRLAAPGDVSATWTALAAEWRAARTARETHNKAFAPLADFAKPGVPAGWVTEGDGFESGFVDDGAPLVALEGDAVFARLLPRGYHTHALSSKLPGALRSPPDAQTPGRFVGLKLAGGQFGGYLEMHENAFQGEEVTFLDQSKPQWRSFADKTLVNGISRVTYTFATSALNPNFPPRTGLAPGLPNNDFGHDKRSWISVTGIVSHDAPGAPLDTLDAFEGLYDGPAPKALEEAQQRVTKWMSGAVIRWCDGKSRAGDQAILDWLLTNKFLPNTAPPGSKLAKLLDEYRRVENGIAFPRTVNGMDERETAKTAYPLNVRGNVDVLGEKIRPDFLKMFAGRNDVAASRGSGRLELADSLLRPDHPLTARVYVNRLWHWVMGAGLVATPDDFGRLGEKPTHPELLDHLAGEFVREGWSSKKLIRRLVLSQTFQQSGLVSEEARELDPGNRLRHHYPTRRLEAEALRDSLLAVSGRLDGHLYGRTIFPPRTAEDGSKRLYPGPLDGNGRRSIYQQMSIMDPPKFLVAFNLPDLRLSTGRRDTTNVPAQALILLNDPFVHAMARHWGQQLVKAAHATPEERVRAVFVAAFARAPTEAELKRWTTAARDFATPGAADLMKDEGAWSQLAHAVFNTKEFLYYR